QPESRYAFLLMPKRSNDFQRLIARIYEQLTDNGRVRESVMLKEKHSRRTREVDVFVESTVAGSAIRIAVECRDHSRKSDMTWIDQLIGKYSDLPVNHVIAVSRKAFSKNAAARAKANNIEVRTLNQAMETDWPTELARIGVGSVNLAVSAKSLCIESE